MIRSVRVLLLVGALALVPTAIGCGDSDDGGGASDPASSQSERDNAQDTARTKLEQCLRDNGVEPPSQGGQGGIGHLSEAEQQKFQDAVEGPCADLRDDVIGDVGPEQRQEFQDAAVKFRACMRDEGIDLGTGTPGAGGGLAQLDSDDPQVREALEKCEDLMPQFGGLGGG
jgi:hypothetical protein